MGKILKNSEAAAGEPVVAGVQVSAPGSSAGGTQGGGAIGAATVAALKARDQRLHGDQARPSPLQQGQGGYLAVTPTRVVLLEIVVGVLGNKAGAVLAEVPRDAVIGVDYPGGAAMIPLALRFADDSSWHFTVAKLYGRQAKGVVAELS